jgi:hypothetical protein
MVIVITTSNKHFRLIDIGQRRLEGNPSHSALSSIRMVIVITTSNKHFRLIDIGQRRLEGNPTGRKLEASSVIIPTIEGIPMASA